MAYLIWGTYSQLFRCLYWDHLIWGPSRHFSSLTQSWVLPFPLSMLPPQWDDPLLPLSLFCYFWPLLHLTLFCVRKQRGTAIFSLLLVLSQFSITVLIVTSILAVLTSHLNTWQLSSLQLSSWQLDALLATDPLHVLRNLIFTTTTEK